MFIETIIESKTVPLMNVNKKCSPLMRHSLAAKISAEMFNALTLLAIISLSVGLCRAQYTCPKDLVKPCICRGPDWVALWRLFTLIPTIAPNFDLDCRTMIRESIR